MIVQNIITGSCTPQTIVIGRRGTYDTLQIAFDLSFLIENYGSGTAVLAVKRSQDESAYPAVVTQDGSTLTWTVSETDTAYVGSGECQLMWYVDGGLAKTIIYPMVVMRDILSTAEKPPDGYENWIERLTELGAETQQNAQNAAQSASDAESAKDEAVTAKEAAVEAASMLQNVSATATTLDPNQPATASYNDGVFSFGIPKGDKGDKMTYADLTEADKLDLIQGPIAEAQADAEQAVEDKGEEVIASIPEDYTELVDEVDGLSDAVSNGNLNQHIKVNPFIIGSGLVTLPLGTLNKNRSTAEILENGAAKFIRNAENPTVRSFGCFIRIKENDGPSNSGHKLYIRLADVDVSNMSNYDRMVISGSNGTDGSQAGIASTNMTLVSGVAEIIVTPDSDFEMLNILAHSTAPASEGEYFTIGSAQYIDLTDMFGAGYEPSLEIFKSVYESGMPYLFSVPTITSDLKDVIALIKNIPDCDIVQTNADIASTTKDYVLVLNNESKYSRGGYLLYKKMPVDSSNGYGRIDGTRVCAVPDQGALGASNAPSDLIMPIVRSYIDNDALVYGNDHGLFDEEVTDELDCSDFVCAVLDGVPYETSKYVSGNTVNTPVADVTNESVSKDEAPAKLNTRYLAEYFAENKRLFSVYPESDKDSYRAVRKLQFGDILFFSDDETIDYASSYYHIKHVAFVLMQVGTTCLIAQAGGRTGIEAIRYGTQVGNCSRLDLTAQGANRYLRVFARPDYSQTESNSILSLLKAVSSGTYEFTIENDYIPGYYFDSTTFDIGFSNTIGLSPVYYDAIGGSVISYVGERVNEDGVPYVVGVVEYDEQYKPLKKTSITSIDATLDQKTRYIRLQFGFAARSNVKCTLHTGDAFKATITVPDSLKDDVSALSNAIEQKAPVIINSASGDIATFADGADDMPVKHLVANIEPVQAAGTPSPTNPLLISGYTGLNVYRESSYDTEADPTVTVNWEDAAGTVYGGTLDVISGQMIVDRRYGYFGPVGSGAHFSISSEPSSAYTNTYVYANSSIGNAIVPNESTQITKAICSHLPSISRTDAAAGSSMSGIFQYHSGDNNQFRLAFPRDEQFSTNEKLNEWFAAQITADTPFAVCFPLKETIEYQLTPQEVTTLLGNNAIWTDVGAVTVEYPADTGLVVSQQKNAIDAKQDATNYVTLSGTIVTQTGADNTMYLCGELAELTFTAPQTGITAIRFTSGTTPTVATFIGVTWLNGFDPTAIEATKTYEVNILNGLGVAAWT